MIDVEVLERFLVEFGDFRDQIGVPDDRSERPAEIVREHRNQIALRLTQLEYGAAAFVQFVIERDVARRDGEVFRDEIEHEQIGVAQRPSARSPGFEDVTSVAELPGVQMRRSYDRRRRLGPRLASAPEMAVSAAAGKRDDAAELIDLDRRTVRLGG